MLQNMETICGNKLNHPSEKKLPIIAIIDVMITIHATTTEPF